MHRLRPAAAVVALIALVGCGGPRVDSRARAQECGKAQDELELAEKALADGYLLRSLAHAETADELCGNDEARAAVATARRELRIDDASAAAEPKADDKAKREALLLYRDGQTARLAGKFDVALARFEKSLAKAWHPLTYVQIGETHRLADNDVEMRKAYARAVALAERRHGKLTARTWAGLERPVLSVDYGPNGRYIAMGVRDGRLVVSDAVTGREVQSGRNDSEAIAAVAFHPNGKQIASAGFDGELRLEPIGGAGTVHEIRAHKGAVLSLSYTADGKRIATGGWDHHTYVWDTATGKQLAHIPDFGAPVKAVAFKPDGAMLAVGTQFGAVRVFDGSSGAPLFGFTTEGEVLSLAFSPDGTLLAVGAADQSVRIYDVATQAEIHKISIRGRPTSLDFADHPQKGLILAIAGSVVSVWENKTRSIVYTLDDAYARVLGVAFGPGGDRLVAGAVDGSVRTYDVMSSRTKLTIGPRYDRVDGIAISSDGRRIAAMRSDNKVVLWDLSQTSPVRVIEPAGLVTDVAFAPDGSALFISGAAPRTIRLAEGTWSKAGLAPVGTRLLFSGDGSTLVAWRRATATLVSARGETRSVPVRAGATLYASPDARSLLVSDYAEATLHTRTGSRDYRSPHPSGVVRGAGFLADGRAVFSALETGNAALAGFGTKLGCDEVVIPGQARISRRDVVAGNGRDLLIQRDDKLQRYDVQLRTTRSIDGAVAPLKAYGMSADGRLVVTVRSDGLLRLFTSEGVWLASLGTRGDEWLAIGPDGRVTGSENAHELIYWKSGSQLHLPGRVAWASALTPDLLRAAQGRLGPRRPWSAKQSGASPTSCLAIVSRAVDPTQRDRTAALPESELLDSDVNDLFDSALPAERVGADTGAIALDIIAQEGAITRAELLRAFKTLREELDRCAKRLRIKAGHVTVAKIAIGPTGAVLRTDVDNFDQKRGRCVWSAFGDMKFQKRPDGKRASVTIKVTF